MEGEKPLLHLDIHTNPECGVGVNIQLSIGDFYREVQDAAEKKMQEITLKDIIERYYEHVETVGHERRFRQPGSQIRQHWDRREEIRMEQKKKIGLVVEGGGMKCAYNAGILDAFLDYGITFDYCIGVSGGSGNAASYAAGQRGRNLRFFTDHIHSPKYFGLKSLLRTGNLFGLEYIYAELTNSTGEDPLDFAAIIKNPIKYEVVATNALTGEAVYFGKEDMQQDDYRPIMASSAIPAACRPVEINGIPYYDGGIADAIPVRHALEQGCERLVVILSKQRDYVRKPQGMRILYSSLCRKYPKIIEAIDNRHITYAKNQKEVFDLEKEGKAFVFAPSEAIKVGTYSMNEETERKLYDLGMKDFAERKEELGHFLGNNISKDISISTI